MGKACNPLDRVPGFGTHKKSAPEARFDFSSNGEVCPMKPYSLNKLKRRMAAWRSITRDARRIATDLAAIGVLAGSLLSGIVMQSQPNIPGKAFASQEMIGVSNGPHR